MGLLLGEAEVRERRAGVLVPSWYQHLPQELARHTLCPEAYRGRLGLRRWAHGTLEPFMTPSGAIDLATEEAQANRHLLKKLKRTVTTTTKGDHETTRETTELELHDPKDAAKELLKLRGAYKQPDGGEVKFLIVRDLKDVEPYEPDPF